MKQIFYKIISFLLALALVVSNPLVSVAHSGRTDSSGGHRDTKNKSGLGSYHYHCGGYPAHLHPSGYCPYTDVFPKGVKITVEKKILRRGETIPFHAEVYPSNACNTHVDVTYENNGVISMSQNKDSITAIGYGTATITAESFNGKITTLTITVKEIKAQKVSVSSSLDDKEPVYIDDSFCCTASIIPEDVDDPSIEWSSSDESIAIVDEKGNVKALAAGKVYIYATASNGVTGKKAFTIKEKKVECVTISEEKLSLLLQSTYSLTAAVVPVDATFPELTWSSSDPSVVEVNKKGLLNAVGCGSAIVTATAKNGVTASASVEVTEVVAERIDITGKSSFFINEDATLQVKFYPVDTTIQEITWSSSAPSVAFIDETGKVSGLAIGEATITATQKDVSASIQIEVKAIPVEEIEILSSVDDPDKLQVGKAMTLWALVHPDNATFKELTWASSNDMVATVDSLGNVTAVAPGTVIITVVSEDGFSQTHEITVSHTIGSFLAEGFSKIRHMFSKRHI